MRKRTRRKVYDLINPILMAVQGAAVSQPEELDKLRMFELNAIDDFANGRATEGRWHDIYALVGICEQMAKSSIGPEALEACERANAALKADWERFEATGRMGTTGPGLQAYRDVYEYHDLQRQSVARGEYEKHIKAATAKVRFKKAALMYWFAARSPWHQDLWCVARSGKGLQPTVEVDGYGTEGEAKKEAKELTMKYQREQARIASAYGSIYDRRLVAGFYQEA